MRTKQRMGPATRRRERSAADSHRLMQHACKTTAVKGPNLTRLMSWAFQASWCRLAERTSKGAPAAAAPVARGQPCGCRICLSQEDLSQYAGFRPSANGCYHGAKWRNRGFEQLWHCCRSWHCSRVPARVQTTWDEGLLHKLGGTSAFIAVTPEPLPQASTHSTQQRVSAAHCL